MFAISALSLTILSFVKGDDIFTSEEETVLWKDPGSMFSQQNINQLPIPALQSAPTPACGDQGSIIILRRLLNKLFRKFHSLEPNEIDGHFYDFSSYLTYQDYKSIDLFLNSSNCADLHSVENVLSKFIEDAELNKPRIEFTWLENSPQLLKRVLDMAPVIVIFIMLYMRSRHSILAALTFSGYVLHYKDKYEERSQEDNIEYGKLLDFCNRPLLNRIFSLKYFQIDCDNIHDSQHTTKPLPNPIHMGIEYLSELLMKPFPLVMKSLGTGYEEFLNSFSFSRCIFGLVIVLSLTWLAFKCIALLFISRIEPRTSRRRKAPKKAIK